MLITKKFPWGSLILLVTAYACWGHLLATFRFPVTSFAIASVVIVLLAVSFILPLMGERGWLSRWFSSDAGTFIIVVILSALAPIVILWWRTFLYLLCIVAAETLVRLDIQTAKLSARSALLILLVASFIGLAIGYLLYLRFG